MKVYISGKIGEEVISDATRQKFARADEMLKAKGYEVFNPCDEKWQDELKRGFETDRLGYKSFPNFYAYVLLRDMMALSTKGAVYFLEDWDKSPGALVEQTFVMAIGMKMLWQRLEDALVFHYEKETAEDVWLPIV